MNYRKLRITWTVAWGVVAVLLCVLWVLSYRWTSDFSTSWFGKRWSFHSNSGQLFIILIYERGDLPGLFPPQLTIRPVTTRFEFSRYGASFYARMPHCFLTIIAAMIAALPWLIVARFSLRTLLIATTLVAVVMGLVVHMAK